MVSSYFSECYYVIAVAIFPFFPFLLCIKIHVANPIIMHIDLRFDHYFYPRFVSSLDAIFYTFRTLSPPLSIRSEFDISFSRSSKSKWNQGDPSSIYLSYFEHRITIKWSWRCDHSKSIYFLSNSMRGSLCMTNQGY